MRLLVVVDSETLQVKDVIPYTPKSFARPFTVDVTRDIYAYIEISPFGLEDVRIIYHPANIDPIEALERVARALSLCYHRVVVCPEPL
jgi:hypothetical protein